MRARSDKADGRTRPGLIDALERVLDGGISLPYDVRAVKYRLGDVGERMVITSMRVQTEGGRSYGDEEDGAPT